MSCLCSVEPDERGSSQSPRLLYFQNSVVERLVRRLPQELERITLPAQSPLLQGSAAAGVFLVDGANGEVTLAMRWKAAHRYLEVVVVGDPNLIRACPSEQVYAYLPVDVPEFILAKTLHNAIAHLQLMREHDQTGADLSTLAKELRELNSIGIKLSAERDTDVLLELILSKAREITQSDAGSLYLVEEDGSGTRRLRFKLAQNDTCDVPFREFTLPITPDSLAGYVALSGEIQNIPDAYSLPPESPFQLNQAFDRQLGYHSKSMLAVPLKTPQEQIIGVFQLINCQGKASESFGKAERRVIPFSQRHQDLAASLASQAAVALENSRLYQNIQNLFEGFVKASVTAIEARDPTTAGHSFRVCELTVRLARAVDRAQAGPYASVRFSPQDIRELRYASILHDFGKVGVREQLLVKSKKLHPGRLEIIQQRLEIIKQGIELRASRNKIRQLLQEERARYAQYAADQDREAADLLREIDEYMEAIVRVNEPSANVQDFSAALQQIALRSFEDHLGRQRKLLTPDEAEFLSIPRGSLTDEERRQIESHVVHTHQFLVQIPWTRELRHVTEIAATHHERLHGRGYPHGLKQEQIPLQAKMMMIADVFDALTAADRPYKKAVPVERALKILIEDRERGAIDGALLDIFIGEGIYRQEIRPQGEPARGFTPGEPPGAESSLTRRRLRGTADPRPGARARSA